MKVSLEKQGPVYQPLQSQLAIFEGRVPPSYFHFARWVRNEFQDRIHRLRQRSTTYNEFLAGTRSQIQPISLGGARYAPPDEQKWNQEARTMAEHLEGLKRIWDIWLGSNHENSKTFGRTEYQEFIDLLFRSLNAFETSWRFDSIVNFPAGAQLVDYEYFAAGEARDIKTDLIALWPDFVLLPFGVDDHMMHEDPLALSGLATGELLAQFPTRPIDGGQKTERGKPIFETPRSLAFHDFRHALNNHVHMPSVGWRHLRSQRRNGPEYFQEKGGAYLSAVSDGLKIWQWLNRQTKNDRETMLQVLVFAFFEIKTLDSVNEIQHWLTSPGTSGFPSQLQVDRRRLRGCTQKLLEQLWQ